jgi:molecular chaperone DnaK
MRLGRVDKVVITVPAYFDDTRRKATQDAGRIAGLDVIDILDEPTAAALAYCLQPSPGTSRPADPDQPQNVLVYDLGGGTFDVSIVRLTRTRFQTLAIEGDVFLGGKDWDDRIVEHVANLFKQQYGEDPREHPLSLVALQSAAERAKRNLSKLPQTTITCSHNGKVLSVTLTRAEFEKLTNYLLLRTRTTTQAALTQAGLTWEQVDRILMVGGSTHMPMTSQMLRQLSGKQPDNSLAVSEVVARGGRPARGHRRRPRRADGPPARPRGAGRFGGCRGNQRQRAQPGHRGTSSQRADQRYSHPQEYATARQRQPHLPHRHRASVARAGEGLAG